MPLPTTLPITVAVPLFDPHPKFLPHFIEWYAANKEKHDLRLAWSWRRPLHYAERSGVDLGRKTQSSHVLFVEDDHWGFPVNGLDVLLEADKDVIGFHTVCRQFPYHSLCMRRGDPTLPVDFFSKPNMFPFEHVTGDPLIQECDLISWGMTLVRTEVFDRIKGDPFESWGKLPTDSVFCRMCDEAGIPRFVHFGYSLPHGDVDPKMRVGLIRLEEARRRIFGKEMVEVPGTLSGLLVAANQLPHIKAACESS